MKLGGEAVRRQAYDAKRQAEQPWRAWYNSKRWYRLRHHQLAAHPLCAFHHSRGEIVAAAVVDHVDPHRGDETKFWLGPFQSLCKACHDGAKKRIEIVGFDKAVGPDGWPLDPHHPANRP